MAQSRPTAPRGYRGPPARGMMGALPAARRGPSGGAAHGQPGTTRPSRRATRAGPCGGSWPAWRSWPRPPSPPSRWCRPPRRRLRSRSSSRPAAVAHHLPELRASTSVTWPPWAHPGDAIEGADFLPRPSGAFGMKSITFDLVDAHTGLPVPTMDAWLHHFVIATIGPDDPACPGHKVFGPQGGADGRHRSGAHPDRLPRSLRRSWSRGQEQWGGLWHVMNMTDTPMDVKITYRIGLQTGADAVQHPCRSPRSGPTATPAPAAPPGTSPATVAPTRSRRDRRPTRSPRTGSSSGDGGHLHGGGIDLVTKHEDGTVMCTNTAHYMVGMENMDGMIESISCCMPHDTVTAGEKISVTSHYDNSAPHHEVMGISVMFTSGTASSPPPRWPAPRPRRRAVPDRPRCGRRRRLGPGRAEASPATFARPTPGGFATNENVF